MQEAQLLLTDEIIKSARYDYIEEHATTRGGGNGFMISCWVSIDHEDMGCGIDAAIAIHTQGEAT